MTGAIDINELVRQKVEAFEQIEADFEASFRFIQEMHGQKRFEALSVADSVQYLHALWVCECKDRLLSVYKNIQRYEGRRCLELLAEWQEGDTADVVEFLNRKLDMLPLPDITRQIQEVRQRGDASGAAQRLEHGRLVMLNRGMNLLHVLDAIFMLAPGELVKEVQVACMQYGHHPMQIEKQLAALETQLYTYAPHQVLARRNMLVMNKMGVSVLTQPTDQPGERSWRVLVSEEAVGPFAEQVIAGYTELTSPLHNNIRAHRFVDRPERSDAEEV